MATENRFRMLSYSQPERARALARQAQVEVDRRWAAYRALAGSQQVSSPRTTPSPAPDPEAPA
jgi:pyruvate-ferredoxin/flavodoxin oxidoreductase